MSWRVEFHCVVIFSRQYIERRSTVQQVGATNQSRVGVVRWDLRWGWGLVAKNEHCGYSFLKMFVFVCLLIAY